MVSLNNITKGFFKHSPSLVTLSLFAVWMAGDLSAQDLKNGGFETNLASWSIFDPGNAKAQGCNIISTDAERYDGFYSAALESPIPARFALGQMLSVTPKGKYRISAWVKCSSKTVLKENEPGVYLRAVFINEQGKDSAADARIIGLSGKVCGRNDSPSQIGNGKLPQDWTMLQVEVEAPEDGKKLSLALFSHGVTGRVYWDYVNIAKY